MSNKFLIALLASGIILLFSQIPSFNTLERQFLDVFFKIRGQEKPHEDIIIVEINDRSLMAVGTWPWPRIYHASLLKILSNYQPSVVFFDMIFSEESSKEQDLVFAKAIEDAGNVVLTYYFPTKFGGGFADEPAGMPIPPFREHAKELGYVNVFPEDDGHLRELPLVKQTGDQIYLHASLATAKAYAHYTAEEIQAFAKQKGTLINFPGPYQSFNVWPFEMLTTMSTLPGKQPKMKEFKNKIILIGHTAAGTAMDLKPTAFSPQMPGVAVQASMVHTLLTKRFISPTPLWLHFILLYLFALLITLVTSHSNTIRSSLYTLASLGILFGICQILFQYARFWIPYLSFFSLGVTLFIVLTIMQLIRVRFEKEIFARELSLASKIQNSFLPSDIPDIPGMKVALYNFPAKHVGGDLYDILALKDDRFGICVGDVSGKGIPAALFMAKSISEFRREANVEQPSIAISNLNDQLAKSGTGGLFLTLLYLILDAKNKVFHFSSAGHEPIMHYQKSTGEVVQRMSDAGMPLGIMAGSLFDFKTETWNSGDSIFMMSDGIKEAMSPKREIYGFDRLTKAIQEAADKSPKEIIDHVLESIRVHVSTAPQHDDMTAVCVKFD